jgi:hypothetical protein
MSRPQKIIPPIKGEFQGIINAVADGKGVNPKDNPEPRKYKAKLVGGPNDGQIWNIGKPLDEIAIVNRIMDRNGSMRVVGTILYKLKSKDEPLEYEFAG